MNNDDIKTRFRGFFLEGAIEIYSSPSVNVFIALSRDTFTKTLSDGHPSRTPRWYFIVNKMAPIAIPVSRFIRSDYSNSIRDTYRFRLVFVRETIPTVGFRPRIVIESRTRSTATELFVFGVAAEPTKRNAAKSKKRRPLYFINRSIGPSKR